MEEATVSVPSNDIEPLAEIAKWLSDNSKPEKRLNFPE
jgi:hypothetical protein